MRNLLKAALVAAPLFLPFAALAVPAPLPPLEPNQIRITAVVPDRRIIVADAQGNIDHFYSNTALPARPEVMAGTMGGAPLALTPTLQHQYEAIMGQLKGRAIVSVAAHTGQTALDYPSFLGQSGARQFTVTPSRTNTNPNPAPYEITVF